VRSRNQTIRQHLGRAAKILNVTRRVLRVPIGDEAFHPDAAKRL
jgi:hypothetical protein